LARPALNTDHVMPALPLVDFSGIKNAVRKTCNQQVENACKKESFNP
jgi:hypothetical protein